MLYHSFHKQGCLYFEKPQTFANAPCGMFFSHFSVLLLDNSLSHSSVVLRIFFYRGKIQVLMKILFMSSKQTLKLYLPPTQNVVWIIEYFMMVLIFSKKKKLKSRRHPQLCTYGLDFYFLIFIELSVALPSHYHCSLPQSFHVCFETASRLLDAFTICRCMQNRRAWEQWLRTIDQRPCQMSFAVFTPSFTKKKMTFILI